jgi:hypothetical protein
VRTDELIRALTADRLASRMPINRTLALGLLLGSALAVAVFVALTGVRANAAASLDQWRFILKFVVTLGLALPATVLLFRVSRPVESSLPWWLLCFAPIALAAGVIGELVMVPAEAWPRRLIGANAIHCLTLIPLFSLTSLACVFAALKQGAPARPRTAGAVGGLVCSGLGAALYALNCPDDSPLFIATWYVLAISVVTLLASIAGARILRW